MGIKGRTLTAGDFCEATEATLATAMAYVEAMDTPDEFAVEPQSLEPVADATNAWKAWTERNCAAEIADRWSGM